MQDLPHSRGVGHVVVEAHEVLSIEVARTEEVPAIEAERTRAEPYEGVRTPLAKEEAEGDEDEEGDGTISGKLVTSAKLAQGLVEMSLLPCSVCEADLFLQALSCDA